MSRFEEKGRIVTVRCCSVYILLLSALCECGQQQAMNYIVNMCPVTKSEGQLQSIHSVEVEYKENTNTLCLRKNVVSNFL